MDQMVTIAHVSKAYGPVQALQDVSFSVQKGQQLAFLGVNGAGKSTTIHILCGFLPADSGQVLVDGCDPVADAATVRAQLGVVFQASVLDSALTGRENLRCRGALYGLRGKALAHRLEELTELLGLQDILDRPLAKLSGGQRRRVDIARALIHSPKLLILDEPTTGLDPQTRQLVWQTVGRLRREQGMTVLLTTHYMEEAADADRVVILDGGRVLAEGTPLALKNRYATDRLTLYGVAEDRVAALGLPYTPLGDGFALSVPDAATATGLITAQPALFKDFELVKGTMDDVFLAVTGRSLRGGGADV